VDTAEGPVAAAFCPGRVTAGDELASESVEASQPPCLTVHPPVPVEDFARPLSTAASAPVASEPAVPEQLVEPAAQCTEAEASDTLSKPPDTVGFAPAWPVLAAAVSTAVFAAVPAGLAAGLAAATRVGWVNRVAEFDWDWQFPSVAVQVDDPVEVFAAAGEPAPVDGSMVTSPDPVEEVFDDPLPEHPVCPGWQVTDTDAPLEPVLWPVPDPVALPNRPAHVVSVESGLVATEPDWLWQPPPATVQEAWPVVARFTVVVCTGAGVTAVAGVTAAPWVGSAGFTEGVTAGLGSAVVVVVAPDCAVAVPGFPVAAVGTVSVWVLFAPVSVVALPVHPVASVAHCTLAWACGPPVPAPVSAALVSALVSAALGRLPPAPVAVPVLPVFAPPVLLPVPAPGALSPPVFAPYR
jgi:hypothetical protein